LLFVAFFHKFTIDFDYTYALNRDLWWKLVCFVGIFRVYAFELHFYNDLLSDRSILNKFSIQLVYLYEKFRFPNFKTQIT